MKMMQFQRALCRLRCVDFYIESGQSVWVNLQWLKQVCILALHPPTLSVLQYLPLELTRALPLKLVNCHLAMQENAPNVPFWDNDSLAALLAVELHADLLILMTDVNGLYTGPPADPASE